MRYNPVVADLKLRIRKEKAYDRPNIINLDNLKDPEVARQHALAVENKFEDLKLINEETTPDIMWESGKTAIKESAETCVGRGEGR